MPALNPYSGSVYAGLGQLLYAYSQAKGLLISEALQRVQSLERFDYALWCELLSEIQQQRPIAALGLEIAEYVQPKHLGILAYIALSCNTLAEALQRYSDFHRLIYDGSTLVVHTEQHYLAIGWSEVPFSLTTQLSNEIAMALMLQLLKHFMQRE